MLAKADSEPVNEVRCLTFTASKTGYFDLVQRRRAKDDYEYFIRRRRAQEKGR
jgi:hypothetical protein